MEPPSDPNGSHDFTHNGEPHGAVQQHYGAGLYDQQGEASAYAVAAAAQVAQAMGQQRLSMPSWVQRYHRLTVHERLDAFFLLCSENKTPPEQVTPRAQGWTKHAVAWIAPIRTWRSVSGSVRSIVDDGQSLDQGRRRW